MNRLLALAFCVPFAVSSFAVAQDKKPDPKPTPAVQPAKKDEAKKDEKKAEQPKKEEAKKEEKKADAPKKNEELLKQAEAAAANLDKPGEMHKWLEQQEGEWQASQVEMGPDGTPGKPEKGTMKSKMEFGGRFLHSDYTGRSGGKFFHGEGFLGYSNANKHFEMCWVDTNMTSVMFLTGQVDAAKKVLTLTGDFPIPGPKAQFKIVSTVVSKDSMKDEMFMVMGGKETKVQEVTYTKGAASGEGKGAEGKSEKKEEKAEKKEEKKSDKK